MRIRVSAVRAYADDAFGLADDESAAHPAADPTVGPNRYKLILMVCFGVPRFFRPGPGESVWCAAAALAAAAAACL